MIFIPAKELYSGFCTLSSSGNNLRPNKAFSSMGHYITKTGVFGSQLLIQSISVVL